MSFPYVKEAVAVIWVVAILAAGLLAGFGSVAQWAALVVLAAVPLIVVQRLWRVPAQTMSESINKARR